MLTIFSDAINSICEFGIRETDVYLHTLAQFHCNGWGVGYAVTGMGGTHVIIKKFEPEVIRQVPVTEEALKAVRDGMAKVTQPGGTAAGLGIDGLPFSGTTTPRRLA